MSRFFSKSNLSRNLIYLALLIIIGLLVYFLDIRFKEVTINSGFGVEARNNPYLAAKQFIATSRGIEIPSNTNSADTTDDQQTSTDGKVQSSAQTTQIDIDKVVETQQGLALLKSLPPTTDTLIITSTRTTVTDQQNARLTQWVEQGGHLIIKAYEQSYLGNEFKRDELIEQFGITLVNFEYDDSTSQTDEQAAQSPSEPQDAQEDQQTAERHSNSTNKPTETVEIEESMPQTIKEQIEYANNNHLRCDNEVNLSPFMTTPTTPDAHAHIKSPYVLEMDNIDDANAWSSDGYGPQLIQLKVGNGVITVMTDLALWSNNRIACFDNAFLLQELISVNGDDAKVWLLYHEQRPSFMQMIWLHHQKTLFSVLILLGIWLWAQSIQYGPIRTVKTGIRREFMEHLEAATRYRWRCGDGQNIIDTLRQNIFAQVKLRHGEFDRLSEEQQIELIGRWSETPSDDVTLALYHPIATKNDQIVVQVRLAQQIRKHLC